MATYKMTTTTPDGLRFYYEDSYGKQIDLPLNTLSSSVTPSYLYVEALENYQFLELYYKDKYGRVQNISFDGLNPVELPVATTSYWATVEYVQPPIVVSGFNNVYVADMDVLKGLSSEIYKYREGDPTNYTEYDLANYVINILELPFTLDESFKGLPAQIRLGYKLIEVEAVKVVTDELVLDLGEIHVPSVYENSYDYLNTNAYLHLPFAPNIELNIDYVINSTISLQYIVDLYTGDTAINIMSDKVGNTVIHSELIKIGKNVPFIRKTGGEVVGTFQTSNGLNNQVFTPFIEIIRNKPYDIDNPFNDNVNVLSKLRDEKGYVTVSNAIINSSASFEESSKIKNLLSRGVYIK